MAVQNMYNNYLKRQTQKPTNQFRQKVANSLSGKSVGNYSTTKPSTQPLGTNTLGTTPQAPKSPSKPFSMNENIFTQPKVQNPLQSTVAPQIATPNPTPNPTQPNNVVTPQTTPQIENNQVSEQSTGMMSLSDINNSLKVENTQPTSSKTIPLTVEDVSTINKLSLSAKVIELSKQSKKTSKPKTPQEIAQQIVVDGKKMLQQEWETKQKQLDEKDKQLNIAFDQSVKDADTSYQKEETNLQDNRYQQQEDMAISGQRRGIQYSPQQLALENVANINYNKNLSELSTKRNELLNKLTIELNKNKSDIMMSRQDATVSFNNASALLTSDYNKQLMNWMRDDQLTQDERKWQESQTKIDRDFQMKMQKAQNNWQSGENKLDRTNSKKGGSYKGFTFNPKSYYASSPSSYSSDWGNYTLSPDLKDPLESNVTTQTAKEYMTDMYNALDYAGVNELDNKAQVYNTTFNEVVDQIPDEKIKEELGKTYDVGLDHLYNKSFARSTNTPYLERGVKITPTSPYRQSYIDEVKQNQPYDRANFYSKYANDKSTKAKNTFNAKILNNTRTLGKLGGNENIKHTGSSTQELKKNISKHVSNSKKNISKSTASSKSNYTKHISSSKKNVSKHISTSKKNLSTASSRVKQVQAKRKASKRPSFQKKVNKSWSNLKKNIKKLFSW